MKKQYHIFATTFFALVSFALAPLAQAVAPPPDGGYPGGNTAEGQSALSSLVRDFRQALLLAEGLNDIQ